MFNGPIFNDSIFSFSPIVFTEIDNNLSISISVSSGIDSTLTDVCSGFKCRNTVASCSKGLYKKALNGNSRAIVAAITVCDQKIHFYEWDR